ncbi:MAG: 30S ribosomal protein S4 [Candidatus Micrarchaeia archaeon]
MGAPKRNRKKYERPKNMWNLERIKEDNSLKEEYGLKNMRELWMIKTELSKLRNIVRAMLSGASKQTESTKTDIIAKLSKYGIVSSNATLDNLLDLRVNVFLDRRLQTVVFKKGLAKTIKQSRQLITHGFISIDGKKITKPGYRVSLSEEQLIGYYKPIDINKSNQQVESETNMATANKESIDAQAVGSINNEQV